MSAALSPGVRIGRYEIKSHLGTGGMGEVYLAYDTTELRRTVAIKVLPARFAANTEQMQRFIREAQTASSLNHPNILTIFEVGEADGVRFIVTEFIDGETLQQRIARTRIAIDETIEIAIQVATALAAAHRAKILHRDIKPANIMVRRDDGIVKLLDFGLAKPTGRQPVEALTDSDAQTEAVLQTSPGIVLGTVAYMSPEQACGADVDERTDIWSLGVVLYEMVAGCLPFMAATTNEVFMLILSKDKAPPLNRYAHDVPDRLEEIVGKALAKDREQRYQSFKDMLVDLKRLKQRHEAGAVFESNAPPERNSSASNVTVVDYPLSQAAKAASAQRATGNAKHPTSSAEYIVSQILSHRRGAALTLAALLVAAIALSYFFYFKQSRPPALTDHDIILIADFDNKTGDSIFDGTLKQGLAVQLEQSPFLSLFPNARVRQVLPLMGRSPDERVTLEIGREICQRQGLKALIVGAIAPLGSHYVITLEAVTGRSGEVLARQQIETESKEQVLKSLSQAASNLREKLGESLASIQKFDAPLEEATTSSLDALKAFSMATELANSGKFLEAISFDKRAVEIDPNFAYAYGGLAALYYNTNQPALAAENATQAFALRERVSEVEKFRLYNYYYTFVTGELDKAIQVLEQHRLAYPRDHRPLISLSDEYFRIGQYEKAVDAAREALKLYPNNAIAYANLVQALFSLNRWAEVKETCERVVEQKLDSTAIHIFLYFVALESGDTAGMQQQLDWAKGRPDEYVALSWETGTAAFSGRMERADLSARRLIELATRSGLKEVAATYEVDVALRGAVIGKCVQTRNILAPSLVPEQHRADVRTALALALCGEQAQVQPLLTDIINRRPNDTIVSGLWVPLIRGALELQRGNATPALELLEVAKRYEAAGEFWPQYVRGQAYLKLGRGAEAAGEFQKILDHRGQAPLSPLYPLAHLGFAQATTLTGSAPRSLKAYEDFFELWKEADPNLPILQEARREYDKLLNSSAMSLSLLYFDAAPKGVLT